MHMTTLSPHFHSSIPSFTELPSKIIEVPASRRLPSESADVLEHTSVLHVFLESVLEADESEVDKSS